MAPFVPRKGSGGRRSRKCQPVENGGRNRHRHSIRRLRLIPGPGSSHRIGIRACLCRASRPTVPPVRNAPACRLVARELPHLLTAARACDGSTPPHARSNVGPIVAWAIETAVRCGEIAATRRKHLNRRARVLPVLETKTRTPRRMPLSTAAFAVLDQLPRPIDGRVWGMRPDSISQAFEWVCRFTSFGKVKTIAGLIFHNLRHEATSRLFEEGLNP